MRAGLLLGTLLVGCEGGAPVETDDTAAVPVLEGPLVTHTPPDGTWREGDVIALEASAEDDDGVDSVELFFRRSGDLPYQQRVLEPVEVETETGVQTVWQGALSGTDVRAPGVEYYLRAFDRSER